MKQLFLVLAIALVFAPPVLAGLVWWSQFVFKAFGLEGCI